jgi:hypothetical protein
MQNFAFYSLVACMLLIVIVQTNAHNETGIRRFVLSRVTWLGHMIYRTCHFKLKRMFINKH